MTIYISLLTNVKIVEHKTDLQIKGILCAISFPTCLHLFSFLGDHHSVPSSVTLVIVDYSVGAYLVQNG